jgi:hypothetical protein
MVSRDDLVNRYYVNKEITAFDYFSEPDEDGEYYRVAFQRRDKTRWQLVLTNFGGMMMDTAQCSVTEVFTVDFYMPKANMPLEYIANMGLSYIQQMFNEAYARYSVWSMELYGKVK